MVKKRVRKKTSKNPRQKRSSSDEVEKLRQDTTQKILTENFIALQKVMTNLAVKFEDLTERINKLLDVFEISAKSLAEKNLDTVESTANKEVLEKIESIIEQNKVIARGVSLLYEKPIIRENIPSPQMPRNPPMQRNPQIQNSNPQQYNRSIIPSEKNLQR